MTDLIVRVGLSVVLIGLAAYDLKREIVPNVVVMPLMLAVLPLTALRLAAGAVSWAQIGLMGLAWAVCFFMQAARMVGGGDAKLAMALIGIFPEREMVYLLLAALLVGHVLILLGRDGGTGLRRVKAITYSALVTHQLPTREEMRAAMEARRNPVTYLISLAGVVYLWA